MSVIEIQITAMPMVSVPIQRDHFSALACQDMLEMELFVPVCVTYIKISSSGITFDELLDKITLWPHCTIA